MDSVDTVGEAINHILLEEEEDEGLEIVNTSEPNYRELVGEARLCLVGKFISQGAVDFASMQQTLAALWKPGKGVYIRELSANLYLFQF